MERTNSDISDDNTKHLEVIAYLCQKCPEAIDMEKYDAFRKAVTTDREEMLKEENSSKFQGIFDQVLKTSKKDDFLSIPNANKDSIKSLMDRNDIINDYDIGILYCFN